MIIEKFDRPFQRQIYDDFVAVFLAQANMVHDFACGHGDFRGINAVRAEHGTATALGTLVEITVPVIQHFPGHIFRTDQFREVLTGKGVIATIDLAQ